MITVTSGKYTNGQPCVIVSIGRPLMETTEAGETVASHVMRISTAREIIQDLLDAIAAVSEERPSTRPS